MSRIALPVALCALLVLAGCAGLPGASAPSGTSGPADGQSVTIVRVVDGDTMEVAFGDGNRETVRLLGVDTPEVHASNAPAEFEGVPETDGGEACLRRWGERATAFAERRLAGETVTFHTDSLSDRRGGYGRLLGYLETGNGTFNRALLAAGLARLYDSSFTERDAYARVESDAQANGTGLWGECRAPNTESGLSATFHADAPGNDNENLREEYVTLRNERRESVALTDWTLSDAAGHAYTFPETALAANDTVRVVTGAGENEPGVRYWGRDRAVWNNDGDTLTLRRPNGTVALRASY